MFDPIPPQKFAEFHADELQSVVSYYVDRKTKMGQTCLKNYDRRRGCGRRHRQNLWPLGMGMASTITKKSCHSLVAKSACTRCHGFPGHIHGVNDAAVGTGRVCWQLAH